jgi:hypothetical protein
MNDFFQLVDTFNSILQTYDYHYHLYENNLNELYEFVENDITSIECSFQDSKVDISVTPSSTLYDPKEVTDAYIVQKNGVLILRDRLDTNLCQMSDQCNLLQDNFDKYHNNDQFFSQVLDSY